MNKKLSKEQEKNKEIEEKEKLESYQGGSIEDAASGNNIDSKYYFFML